MSDGFTELNMDTVNEQARELCIYLVWEDDRTLLFRGITV